MKPGSVCSLSSTTGGQGVLDDFGPVFDGVAFVNSWEKQNYM